MSFDYVSNSGIDSIPLNSSTHQLFGEEFVAQSGISLSFATKSLSDRKTVFVRDLGDPRLTMRGALPVVLQSWGEQTIAYSLDTDDFAIGKDESSAIDELRASVVDLFFLLKDDQVHLGPLPTKHWNFLRSFIEEL